MTVTSKKKKTVSKASKRKVKRRTAKKKSSTRPATAHQERSARREVNGTPGPAPILHCTLAPMQSSSLLIPTNVIAEVVEYGEPEPVDSTPRWFLGHIDWEARQIPVFSYSALISGSEPGSISSKSRIMIVKSLSDSARLPYLGILISDIPKLVNIQIEQLENTGEEGKSLGVFCHVNVNGQSAVIPDLDRLCHLITHAAYGILPITQAE